MNDAELGKVYRALTEDQHDELNERLDEVIRYSKSRYDIGPCSRDLLIRAYFAGRESVAEPRKYVRVGDLLPSKEG
jgi:hypothetical protein